MTRTCCISTCLNNYRKTKNVCVIDEKTCSLSTITYHIIPSNPFIRQKWIDATGRTDLLNSKSRNMYVCSEHFKESDYDVKLISEDDCGTTKMKRFLKRTAIPTEQLGSVIITGNAEVYLRETFPHGNGFDIVRDNQNIPDTPNKDKEINMPFTYSRKKNKDLDLKKILPEKNSKTRKEIMSCFIKPDTTKHEKDDVEIENTSTILETILTQKSLVADDLKQSVDKNFDTQTWNVLPRLNDHLPETLVETELNKSNVCPLETLKFTSATIKRETNENEHISKNLATNGILDDHHETLDIEKSVKKEFASNSHTGCCNDAQKLKELEINYEKLLCQYSTLKSDYDILKLKYDEQKHAMLKCETILKQYNS